MKSQTPDRSFISLNMQADIIAVLRYFQLFSWPLTLREMIRFYPAPVAEEAMRETLQHLVLAGTVYGCEGYYQLDQKDNQQIAWRRDCEARATRLWPTARRMARIIGSFPFVRSVLISGSLSKNAMAPTSDIDFFIITHPGRLWIARTLLILFKRVFLFNSHRYFCVNYFIDTDHLAIREHNRFTATEMVTLCPLDGLHWYDALQKANEWAWKMLPNFPPHAVKTASVRPDGLLKRLLEKSLSGSVGEWLDQQWMQMSLRFWKRKFRDLSDETFRRVVRCSRHEAKLHPMQYQKRVLEALKTDTGWMR